MITLETYHYPEQYGHLLREVDEHKMTILHEEGMYRHLRFAKPGTRIYSWDLITWPGYLTIQGDIGSGSVFHREEDMLRFFDHGQAHGWINPGYWAEKTPDGGRLSREFSSQRFVRWVDTRLDQSMDTSGPNGLRPETEGVLEAAEDACSTEQAIEVLNYHDIAWDFEDPESWNDYNYHFILGLHAILWGAKKYHAHQEANR